MNLIAYRLPGEDKKQIYATATGIPVDFQNPRNGFIVAPFNPESEGTFYEYVKKMATIPTEVIKKNITAFQTIEQSIEEYADYISAIKQELEGNTDRKIVAARRKTVTLQHNPETLFDQLCTAYPDAFVFFISTQEYGIWIGASPELLLEKKSYRVKSMSLAGTRPAGSKGPWDQKNIEEQEIVTRRIQKTFSAHRVEVYKGECLTKKAGEIEHLMTPIEAILDEKSDIPGILKDLSPTPALAGEPRQKALEVIKKYEGDRILYGGYCGPQNANGDFRLNVILRCANIHPGLMRATLFGGGGITYLSDTLAEWEETERKMQTLAKFF